MLPGAGRWNESPREIAAARERMDEDHSASALLHEAIASLPEKYRDPIVLCDLEGLTYQAAAERLGCPVGTVSVRLMRARARIRDRLLRQGEIDPIELSVRAIGRARISASLPGAHRGDGTARHGLLLTDRPGSEFRFQSTSQNSWKESFIPCS